VFISSVYYCVLFFSLPFIGELNIAGNGFEGEIPDISNLENLGEWE
jgi:hypothetical protein